MEIFIYSSTPLEDAKGEIEDAIEEALEGVCEVTGGGTGTEGWNIDLWVSDEQQERDVLEVLRTVLMRFGVADPRFDVHPPADES